MILDQRRKRSGFGLGALVYSTLPAQYCVTRQELSRTSVLVQRPLWTSNPMQHRQMGKATYTASYISKAELISNRVWSATNSVFLGDEHELVCQDEGQ